MNIRKGKGLTLVEVVIATGIFLLLLGMLSNTFISTVDDWHKTQAEVGTQQQAMLGISKVFREIVYSNSASVTILNSGGYKAISFISLEDLRGSPAGSKISEDDLEDTVYDTSSIEWKKFVIYYYYEVKNEEGEVIESGIKRKEIPYSNSSEVRKITVASLKDIVDNVKYANAKYPAKVAARDIEDIGFFTPDYPAIDIAIKTGISYSSKGARTDKVARTVLYMKFLPQN